MLGAHVSTAGRLARAPENGRALAAEAIQVFTSNQVHSRRDRHESIGRGHLGVETFRRVVRDPRLRTVPKVLETPGPLARWASELRLLRRLRDGD